ncbi:MAG: Holliday junction branch migration protein RuvA [Calditrichaeota bacterium]|nr:MAG: Holliday junction branch migration protein RuvA [Calditrichota bacterium]
MIAFLRGKIVDKSPTVVIIEINGIGLEVQIPLSTWQRLGAEGEEAFLLTHLHVREDALILFGFATPEERELFRDLQTVSGIGPRLALTILSGSPVQHIYRAIASGDEESLTHTKGLGKKTAQRLILDLKERAAEKTKQIAPAPFYERSLPRETVEQGTLAMISLGYSRKEAETAISKAAAKSGAASVEELIRIALSGE